VVIKVHMENWSVAIYVSIPLGFHYLQVEKRQKKERVISEKEDKKILLVFNIFYSVLTQCIRSLTEMAHWFVDSAN